MVVLRGDGTPTYMHVGRWVDDHDSASPISSAATTI